MPINSGQETDATGAVYQVERDADTGEELRRVRLGIDRQPRKVRLESALDESADDLMRIQWRIDHIADYGLGPVATTVLLDALTARKAAALARDITLLTTWRNA